MLSSSRVRKEMKCSISERFLNNRRETLLALAPWAWSCRMERKVLEMIQMMITKFKKVSKKVNTGFTFKTKEINKKP